MIEELAMLLLKFQHLRKSEEGVLVDIDAAQVPFCWSQAIGSLVGPVLWWEACLSIEEGTSEVLEREELWREICVKNSSCPGPFGGYCFSPGYRPR